MKMFSIFIPLFVNCIKITLHLLIVNTDASISINVFVRYFSGSYVDDFRRMLISVKRVANCREKFMIIFSIMSICFYYWSPFFFLVSIILLVSDVSFTSNKLFSIMLNIRRLFSQQWKAFLLKVSPFIRSGSWRYDTIMVPNIMSDQVVFPKTRSVFSVYEPG